VDVLLDDSKLAPYSTEYTCGCVRGTLSLIIQGL